MIETAIDDTSREARLNVFSPLGDSAVEACRVLRSDHLADAGEGACCRGFAVSFATTQGVVRTEGPGAG